MPSLEFPVRSHGLRSGNLPAASVWLDDRAQIRRSVRSAFHFLLAPLLTRPVAGDRISIYDHSLNIGVDSTYMVC